METRLVTFSHPKAEVRITKDEPTFDYDILDLNGEFEGYLSHDPTEDWSGVELAVPADLIGIDFGKKEPTLHLFRNGYLDIIKD